MDVWSTAKCVTKLLHYIVFHASLQEPFVLGCFIDFQWTRFQLAAVRLNACDNKYCSEYAPHRCQITEWLTPPALDDAQWKLFLHRADKHILHYYKREVSQETTIPQLVHINDILIIKTDNCDLATDMDSQDITWFQDNLQMMLYANSCI